MKPTKANPSEFIFKNKKADGDYSEYLKNDKIKAFCDTLFLASLEAEDTEEFLNKFEKNIVSVHLSIVLGIKNFTVEENKQLVEEIFDFCEKNPLLNDPFAVSGIVKGKLKIK